MKFTKYLIVFAMILATSSVFANVSSKKCDVPDVQNYVRPNVDGQPTKVKIGVRMLDLSKIDDVGQSLMGDFGISLKWKDPRLADLAGCEVPLDSVWNPGIVILNAGRKFPTMPEMVSIGKGGNVKYIQRYFGTYATYHKLHDFPFDKHELKISLVPIASDEKEVELIVDENVTGRAKRLNIPDWNIGAVRGEVDRFFTDVYDRYLSRYQFTINAKRITNYYLLKILLPLCLIVVMSWAVFWIDPSQFGPQIGLSATSMLTLIAFLFATSTMLPKLGYFTVLDVFISGSTILVFMALLESVITSFLAANEKGALSRKIDRISRIVFPVLFVVFVMIIFVV